MKKPASILLVLLVIGLIVSCHKEQEKNITFGNTRVMKIENYDKLIELGESMVFDIDNDGTNDLKLESWYDGPIAAGDYQVLRLHCLNENVALLGEMVDKQWYKHQDTTILNDNEFVIVLYFTVINYCEQLSENDEIHTTNQFVLSANDPNDTFSVDDFFKSDEVILFLDNDDSGPLDNCIVSNDTTYMWDSSVVSDCNNFPTNTEKYIGFKITKDDTPHLGWLKLNLMGSHTVKVHLIETAIQK